jgi:3-oxoacyl-[acyl-carrier-protein] synthase-1
MTSMSLVVTGLGMVSSVGWDVASSCAAIRAGITRPRPLPDVFVPDQDLLEPVPLMGHPVSGLTDGFGPLGRWLRLARACVEDMRATAGLPPPTDASFWNSTGLLCVLPHLEEARYLEVRDFGPELLTTSWLERLVPALGLASRPSPVHFIHAGHAGTAFALQLARQWLAARNFERVLVLSVDSYLDETSLEWLLEHRRLKTPDRPVGLMPGEAGACLLVEPIQSARQRSAPVLATVAAVATGREAGSFVAGQPQRGEALTRVLEEVLAQQPAGGGWAGNIICDLNGEQWRAGAWGHAQVRLRARLSDRTRLLLPCVSLGDVGAASGAVGLCVAAHAFARKYALGDQSLVLSSAEHGEVGAIHVQRAPKGPS